MAAHAHLSPEILSALDTLTAATTAAATELGKNLLRDGLSPDIAGTIIAEVYMSSAVIVAAGIAEVHGYQLHPEVFVDKLNAILRRVVICAATGNEASASPRTLN